ncbi:glycosyltransferase family 4 protein [Elizabethkingia meningoseptica]|uniref:glycosyltransferase family 4 protein n=1 Tax=Elizabethkingia meningoseptica TaxID=238 RepID=UPI0023AFAEDE|nr:glycosyltransferase family 4 protein [Elizabethkingia meningoseptica]MDE5507627.1 glycosyltransferase family 4 protein [Elizabethkingia meningoseptica]MDE5526768.1 glycosyltransferase family 4 protein [Elizabethkingia meningoseptica]MDE5530774.1 glycosyltransferase family 4 protein [Elizabethkingia meningoseptica]MDE5534331.1 glycosyltransferase family 4 protein [Elizabethkingia meningoseptica]MDE5542393.1 glycosyltransferase family 4 protein [Elizabethkingia meningoseptica]
MRIVYSILGTFNSGGMERVLANKANYFAALGYDVNIVTTDQKGRSSYFQLDNRIKQYDLDINYHDNESKNLLVKLLTYPQKQKLHKIKLEELLRKLKADIVISMFDNDSSFVYKLNDGSKKILEIHFSRFKRIQYGRKGILGIIDKYRNINDLKLARKYDRFVVLTEEDKSYWGNLSNIEVIPNANSFIPSDRASLMNKRVIAVGRYDYQKGFDGLIKIWKTIYDHNPDWRLDIFGNGPLKDELQDMIKDLNLLDIVQLHPPVKNIEKEYLESSILVMTSRYEGLPMALLEAQACGLPMVAYACKCGPKDIIKDGINGYLIPEGEYQLMSDKLLTIINNIELRKKMGTMAEQLSHNFSEEYVMKLWTNLFERLLK